MPKFVLPDEQKKRIQEGYTKFLIAEDIAKKLALIGRPNVEAEVKIQELKAQTKRMAKVFEIDLSEE